MNDSSIKNAQNRLIWLEQLLSSNIIPAPDLIPYLKDLRSFCTLSIPGFFKKISYNTLQNATLDPKASFQTNTNARDRWELMKIKREQAYKFLQNTFLSQPTSTDPEPTVKEYKAEIKECLWHATQCSQAYLELYQALKLFLEEDDYKSADIDRIKLKSIFDKSRITYLNIISPKPSPEPRKFRLLEGGKDA
jgi:hypothetical protein